MAQESTLQTKILNDLRSMGKDCVAFKIMKASEDGVPDIFFTTFKTGAVFIECKAPNGVISPKQKAMIQWLNGCGVKAYECWGINDWINIKRELGML